METIIDRDTVAEITSHFKALTSVIPLHPIRSEGEYDKAVATLNQLLDAGVANEGHPLADLVNTLGSLISDYDDAHYSIEKVAPMEVLRLLMNQHELGQSDLPEVGSQGVVSEILRGKRELNVRQIKALSERFHVPTSVFI
ncbi:MAG: transcriptional regulator [Herminiimonas sp.]|nr:transcriptional regulator [Herminiimonas sp.]